jgi:hypothetical protein
VLGESEWENRSPIHRVREYELGEKLTPKILVYGVQRLILRLVAFGQLRKVVLGHPTSVGWLVGFFHAGLQPGAKFLVFVAIGELPQQE